MCYQQQGLKWLKSSMMCPKRAEETENIACVWGHAVSSCLLARRYSVNIGDLYQGEPWLKVTEDMQKSRGIWCEIGNGLQGFCKCEKNDVRETTRKNTGSEFPPVTNSVQKSHSVYSEVYMLRCWVTFAICVVPMQFTWTERAVVWNRVFVFC